MKYQKYSPDTLQEKLEDIRIDFMNAYDILVLKKYDIKNNPDKLLNLKDSIKMLEELNLQMKILQKELEK